MYEKNLINLFNFKLSKEKHCVYLQLTTAEYTANAFSSNLKYENLAVVVHVLQTQQNLVISRCCFEEAGKEMYQELKRTCTSIVLLINASCYDFSIQEMRYVFKSQKTKDRKFYLADKKRWKSQFLIFDPENAPYV